MIGPMQCVGEPNTSYVRHRKPTSGVFQRPACSDKGRRLVGDEARKEAKGLVKRTIHANKETPGLGAVVCLG
jgi:hypothetical protein